MDLEDIKAFLQIVEHGSVQGAARQERIARSTLRRRLQKLEAEVGGELLRTNGAGVAVTPTGAVIFKEGQLLLERSARMLSSAKASRDEPAGHLRFFMPVGSPDRVRITMIQALRALAPGLRIDQREFADPLRHVREPFELMLHFGAPPDRGEWFSRVLHRGRLIPVASQAYLEAAGRPRTVEELAAHTVLGWRRPGSDPTEWPLWDGGSVHVDAVLVSDNAQLIHLGVQEGMGIALGMSEPSFLLDPTPLVPVLDDTVGGEIVLRCLSPMPASADPRIRTLLTNLHAFLEALPRSQPVLAG